MKKNGKVCTMIVHEAIDNVRSTNQVLHYSSPKTSEDANEFLMKLQQFLLHELQNSQEHPGHTTNNQVYDDNLYSSMKKFWNLFSGEIRHEYTCTFCRSSSEKLEPTDHLLLKFPEEFHESNHNCTVESLIEFMLQDEQVNRTCAVCGNTSAIETQKITKYPYFMCIILFRNTFAEDRAGHISSAVQFPAIGFDIRGDDKPYDLVASVHRHPRKNGSGHFTAICRSNNLQPHQWIEYDDHEVFQSKFTNMKKPGTVLTNRMKTAYILFYVSPSFETRNGNARTVDLMDVEEGQTRLALLNGVENSADYDLGGEEGNADGYEDNSNILIDGEDDRSKDDEEEGREIGEKEASGGDESSSTYESESSSGDGSSSK